MAFFDSVPQAPVDPILGITVAFANDPRKNKINLGVGTYKTSALKPYVLESVKETEKALLEEDLSKEYLPIEGDQLFLPLVKTLVLGADDPCAFIAQTVGGTGALRIGGAFLRSFGVEEIFVPDPTWDNHRRIFTHSGLKLGVYPYYAPEKKAFDFASMLESLYELPEKSAVVLHACCHNPTGFDPSLEQWKEIAAVMAKRHLFPFFDFAYQGFGEGIEQDAAAIRHFVKEGLEVLIATSFSKNFGLYAERTGTLLAVCKNPQAALCVGSQLKVLIRGLYSNPPCHGSRLVGRILGDEKLKAAWQREVDSMRLRIKEMRHLLLAALEVQIKDSRYEFMRSQKGMFSYTGLEENQVNELTETYGIYLPKDGRINVAGLNSAIIPFVAEAIARVQK